MGSMSTKLFLLSLNGKCFVEYSMLHDAVHSLVMKSGDLFPRGYDASLIIDGAMRHGKIRRTLRGYEVNFKQELQMAS